MTKLSTLFVIGALALTGCKKEQANEAPANKAATNATPTPVKAEPKPFEGTELANFYLECHKHFSAGNMDGLKACYAPDAKSTFVDSVAFTAPLMGLQAIMANTTEFRTAFPDVTSTPQLILVNGRNIAAIVLVAGTNTGAMKSPKGEMPATGKKFGQLQLHLVTVNAANQVTEESWIADEGAMMAQLGLFENHGRPLMEKGMDGAPIIAVAANNETETANVAMARQGNEQFNKRDLTGALATVADDVVESDQGSPADMVGKPAMEAGWKMFTGAFPDGKMTEKTLWAAGDYVLSMTEFTGTMTGDMGPMKNTGKPAKFIAAELVKYEGGKVKHLTRFYNGAQMALQMGWMPAHEAAPAAAAPAAAAPEAAKATATTTKTVTTTETKSSN